VAVQTGWKPGPFRWSGVVGRQAAAVWIPGHGDVLVDVGARELGTVWVWRVVDAATRETVAEGVKNGATGRERAITVARNAVVEYASKVLS